MTTTRKKPVLDLSGEEFHGGSDPMPSLTPQHADSADANAFFDDDEPVSSRSNAYVKEETRPPPLSPLSLNDESLFGGVDPLPSRGTPTPTSDSSQLGFFKDEENRPQSSRSNEYINEESKPSPLSTDGQLFNGVDPLPSRGTPQSDSSQQGFWDDEGQPGPAQAKPPHLDGLEGLGGADPMPSLTPKAGEGDDSELEDSGSSSRSNEYVRQNSRPEPLSPDAGLFNGSDPLPSRGTPTPTKKGKGFFKDDHEDGDEKKEEEEEGEGAGAGASGAKEGSGESQPSAGFGTQAQAHPILTKQAAAVVNGVHTEVVLNRYADRIFVMVTQMEKVGTLLQGRAEDTGHGHKNYTVKVVFGRRDDPLLLVYARQLVEQASKTADVPLLLAISLKDRSSSTFQAVMNMLLKNKVW